MAFAVTMRALAAVVVVIFAAGVVWALAAGHALYDKEAEKYVGCALQVLQGDLHDLLGNYLKFASYILFLVPFMALNAPWSAIIAQAVLAVLAAHAAGRLAADLSGRPVAAPFTFALMLLCIPLQQWVPALYTESFFASVVLLPWYRVVVRGILDPWAWLTALVVVFARPVGFCFVLPLLVGTLVHKTWPARSTGVLAGLMALMLLAAMALPGIPMAQLRPIVEGDVICGEPRYPGLAQQLEGASILAAQRLLFAQDPAMATGLFLRRVLSLLTLTRPHFSAAHNALNASYYLLVAAAARGWWMLRGLFVARAMGVAVLMYVLLIGFTHDEWSGRFFVPLWPVICVFAGAAAARRWAS